MALKIVGILGMGQMGAGIAQVVSKHYVTKVFDLSKDNIAKALKQIEKRLDSAIEKGKLSTSERNQMLGNLRAVDKLEDFKDCDLVIEAVFENVDLKKKIFKDLDSVVQSSAILASNTSSISIQDLAKQTKRAERVVGIHFMNPVAVMKLVEGIMGQQTSQAVKNEVQKFIESLDKRLIWAKDYPGFAINRVLMPMINEAICAVEEGIVSIEDLDVGMELGTHQPMGPLKLADFIGLDTCLAIMEVLYRGFNNEKYRPSALLKKYVQEGKLGKKVGKGFYSYN